jgi:hypothetical protein
LMEWMDRWNGLIESMDQLMEWMDRWKTSYSYS